MISENVDVEAVDQLIIDLLESTICVGAGHCGEAFDTVFEGRIIDMWLVVVEAVKYYFADFFAKGVDLFSKFKKKSENKDQGQDQSQETNMAQED